MGNNSRPVLLVFDKSNLLIHAGDPESIGIELITDYVMKGFTLTTITIEEYQRKNITTYETKAFVYRKEEMRKMLGEAWDECDTYKGFVTTSELEQKKEKYINSLLKDK